MFLRVFPHWDSQSGARGGFGKEVTLVVISNRRKMAPVSMELGSSSVSSGGLGVCLNSFWFRLLPPGFTERTLFLPPNSVSLNLEPGDHS